MTEALISPKDIEIFDGAPRIAASSLASALGFSRSRKLRELINRNMDELRSYGHMPQVGRMIVVGNGARRKVKDTLLNEYQSLVLAALSDAPKAPAVRRALIEVFVAWRRGHLSGADAQPRADQQQLPPPAQSLSRNDWRNRNRIRHHKLELARAVMCLDDLGVDVLAIDMNAVVSFSRFLSGRESTSVSKEA